MSFWLKGTELKGATVSLIPMTADHRDEMVRAASDGRLWELWYTSVPSQSTIDQYIEQALIDKSLGKAFPFVVVDNKTGCIIGSTRFCNGTETQRRIEIGYTWYSKSYQRTNVNTQCKLMLLTHAFESLETIAVEFRTHWHNHASRTAIARLGAKQDGVLRNHMMDTDGNYRDTVVFSITNSEWPTVRKSLMYRLDQMSDK